MSFAWTDYLEVARELTHRDRVSPAEACQRASIGRAYYAVFGYAIQVFCELGEYRKARSGEDHSQLATQLKQSTEKRRRLIGAHLERLRPARHWADYEPGPPRQRGLFQSGGPACDLAKQAIELIASVHANPTRV